MKVLMFGWEYPPHNSGGLGIACQGLARSLVAQGVELLFVLPKRLGPIKAPFRVIYANVPDVTLVEINSLLLPYSTPEQYEHLQAAYPGKIYASSLFEEVNRYAAIASEIAKKEDFDLIHSHDWLTFGAGISAKKVKHTPLIAHVHATEVDRTGSIHKVNPHVYQKESEGLSNADKIISVSELTKNNLVSYYNAPPEKIEVVHNGVDRSNYCLSAGKDSGLIMLKSMGYKIILFVGRITLQKGPDYLVEAAKIVLKEYPKAIFVIVGSGDMEGQIMQQVAACGISGNFLFPGFLRGEELSQVYRTADVFVMPSVSEPFGLTPLESLLHGTPVIISRQTGVSEVLHHALKVDFWDTQEMADKILSVISHKSLRTTLGKNGHREACLCTWDKAAQSCIQIYNSISA
jgi:glycogen(starch) synthase